MMLSHLKLSLTVDLRILHLYCPYNNFTSILANHYPLYFEPSPLVLYLVSLNPLFLYKKKNNNIVGLGRRIIINLYSLKKKNNGTENVVSLVADK